MIGVSLLKMEEYNVGKMVYKKNTLVFCLIFYNMTYSCHIMYVILLITQE